MGDKTYKQQKRILFLTDFQRISYGVVGYRYRKVLLNLGIESEEIQTPDSDSQRSEIASKYKGSIVFHNTLGFNFIPIPECYNIALPAHEWNLYPRDWCENLNRFDESWAPSHHVRNLLKRSGVITPVYFMPEALNLHSIPQKTQWNVDKPFQFLFCGESHFRKGHHLLMQGFMLAFPKIGEATLTIKMSPSCDWIPPREDIIFIKEFWPLEKLLGLYKEYDCFVTASLAEGLGAPLAEAILARLPVMANRWGGHTDLVPPNHPFIIKHKVVDQPFCSRPEYYTASQKCALSLPHEVAKTLRKVFESTPQERLESTQLALDYLLRLYDKDIVLKRIQRRLENFNMS
ncbi:MAG: hypothetical protein A2007_04345 [Verrucomicrobia bacterium GWC2_42_7]|nr:MAG: hypothetical protein A2007_04345 [Verrucomicrobia bacterium GWC2_42_7]